MKLQNKNTIVTGGASGFGAGIVARFLEEGANVTIVDFDETAALAYMESLKSDRVHFEYADLADGKSVAELFDRLQTRWSRLDVLVNNAGMRFRKEFLEISEDELDQVLNVNLKSIVFLSQKVLPYMIEKNRGKIINMSSIAGTLGFANLSGYVMSKAAIVGLTKSLAVEFSDKNIQVNALAPGFCKTSYFEKFQENTELYDFTLSRIPMNRWGSSKEVADVCVFLASNMSNYMTGEVLKVDGGWSAG